MSDAEGEDKQSWRSLVNKGKTKPMPKPKPRSSEGSRSSSSLSTSTSATSSVDGDGGGDFVRATDGQYHNVATLGRGQVRLVDTKRRIYRPRSPVRPGNYVENALAKKGKNPLERTTPPEEEENANQNQSSAPSPSPHPQPKWGNQSKSKKKGSRKEDKNKFTPSVDWTEDLIHVEIGSGDPRGMIKYGMIQRQEILASLYASCDGDPADYRPSPEKKRFIVIEFGSYLTGQYATMPAEVTIADFNVIDGIKSCYTRMLDPRVIPLGYRSEVKDAMKTKGYLEPGFDPSFDWWRDCFLYIETIMNELKSGGDQPGYLYVMPKSARRIKECLTWISTGLKRQFSFKLMPLPTLVHVLLTEAIHLRNNNRMRSGFAPIGEVHVLKLLLDEENDFEPKLACNFHQLPSRERSIPHCTNIKVKCRIYNALALLARYYKCPRYVFNHYPKLPKMVFTSEPKMNTNPTLDYLNAQMSDVSSNHSSVRTVDLIYEARGASTVSSESALSSLLESEQEEEQQLEDPNTINKNLGTLEAFPKNTNKMGEMFPIKPDMAEREFPMDPTPVFANSGTERVPREIKCTSCWQVKCMCNSSGTPGKTRADLDPETVAFYRRFGNRLGGSWYIIEETHQNEEMYGQLSSDSDESVSEASISPHDSASQVGRNRSGASISFDSSESAMSTSSCYGSGVEDDLELRSAPIVVKQKKLAVVTKQAEASKQGLEVEVEDEREKILSPAQKAELKTMKEWQNVLPASGSAGRGKYVWGLNEDPRATKGQSSGPKGLSSLKSLSLSQDKDEEDAKGPEETFEEDEGY